MKTTQRATIVIRGPKDAVAAVPCLLGFHPERSLVAVGVGAPEGTCAVRTDLSPPGDHDVGPPGTPPGIPGGIPSGTPPGIPGGPGAPAGDAPGPGEPGGFDDPGDGLDGDPRDHVEAAAGHLAHVLQGNGFASALLVGYGPDALVAPAIGTARRAFAGAGIKVVDALRVENDRFWSYLCDDPACCPPEGTRFDFRASEAAADAVVRGRVVLSGRDELARTVAPLGGLVRDSMRQATDRAEGRLFRWIREGASPAAVRERMEHQGLALVRSLAEGIGATEPWPAGRAPDDDTFAWLALLLTNLRVRDEAWVRIDRDRADGHVAFWRAVLRRAEPGYAAAPGALLGYAAYQAGDGGLANLALDRADADQPGYSMAELLREVITLGIPPDKAALPMSPEALADAYDRRRWCDENDLTEPRD